VHEEDPGCARRIQGARGESRLHEKNRRCTKPGGESRVRKENPGCAKRIQGARGETRVREKTSIYESQITDQVAATYKYMCWLGLYPYIKAWRNYNSPPIGGSIIPPRPRRKMHDSDDAFLRGLDIPRAVHGTNLSLQARPIHSLGPHNHDNHSIMNQAMTCMKLNFPLHHVPHVHKLHRFSPIGADGNHIYPSFYVVRYSCDVT
jgi:hypothetical protein